MGCSSSAPVEPQTPVVETLTAEAVESNRKVQQFAVELWLANAVDSLRVVLALPEEKRRPFFDFLKASHSDNHLAFYFRVEGLRQLRDKGDDAAIAQQLRQEAEAIHARYIRRGSADEVNVPARMQGPAVAGPDVLEVLQTAQEEVLRLLALDAFPRFLHSRHADDMMRELAATEGTAHTEMTVSSSGEQPTRTSTAPPSLMQQLAEAREELTLGPEYADRDAEKGGHVKREPRAPTVHLTRWLDMLKATAQLITGISITVSDASVIGLPLVFVNRAFTATTGYTLEEIRGTNCRFLQGADTKAEDVDALRQALGNGLEIRKEILNYTKQGKPFRNYLTLLPVYEAVPPEEDVTRQLKAGLLVKLVPEDGNEAAAEKLTPGHPHAASSTQTRLRLAFFLGIQFECGDGEVPAARLVRNDALIRLLPTRVWSL